MIFGRPSEVSIRPDLAIDYAIPEASNTFSSAYLARMLAPKLVQNGLVSFSHKLLGNYAGEISNKR
jgi:hypothetical protein